MCDLGPQLARLFFSVRTSRLRNSLVAQCFWATALHEYTAAVVPPGSAVARRSAEVLDELLAKGEAAPLRLGQLPVRFEKGGGAKGKARREVPVSVRC